MDKITEFSSKNTFTNFVNLYKINLNKKYFKI